MAVVRRVLPYVLVIAIAAGMHLFRARDLAQGMAPELDGTLLDGTRFSLTRLEGQPGIVYFWASWCGICRAMGGTMNAIAAEFPTVSVAVQSGDAAAVRRYAAEHAMTMPVMLDETGAVGRRFGIRGVPAIFVLGPDGAIRFATVGYTSELGLRVRLWLAGMA